MHALQQQRPLESLFRASGQAWGRTSTPRRRIHTRFRDADASPAEQAAPGAPRSESSALGPQQQLRQQVEQQQLYPAQRRSPFQGQQLGHSRFGRGAPHICCFQQQDGSSVFYVRPELQELLEQWWPKPQQWLLRQRQQQQQQEGQQGIIKASSSAGPGPSSSDSGGGSSLALWLRVALWRRPAAALAAAVAAALAVTRLGAGQPSDNLPPLLVLLRGLAAGLVAGLVVALPVVGVLHGLAACG